MSLLLFEYINLNKLAACYFDGLVKTSKINAKTQRRCQLIVILKISLRLRVIAFTK